MLVEFFTFAPDHEKPSSVERMMDILHRFCKSKKVSADFNWNDRQPVIENDR